MADSALVISLSPHAKSKRTVRQIMWMVVIALVPALAMSVVVFGPWTLLVVGVAVLSALAAEMLAWYFISYRKAEDKTSVKPSISDGSAVVTGFLLAFNLPSNLPLGQVALGAAFAIIVAKMVFGGLGQNPFNPALAGRAFLMASFPATMTSFPKALQWHGWDAVSAATALTAAKEGAATILPSHLDLFLGLNGGCLGEVSALALLIGGLFLIVTGLINWETPLAYLGGLGLITGLNFLIKGTGALDPLYHLLSGGAFLAAFFMVTDMATSPMTRLGRTIFAFFAGLLSGVIRLFGSYPEGASYAILIMNALVPVFDRIFKPQRFGRAPSIKAGRA